jgi:SAM-dependent methyltransferase
MRVAFGVEVRVALDDDGAARRWSSLVASVASRFLISSLLGHVLLRRPNFNPLTSESHAQVRIPAHPPTASPIQRETASLILCRTRRVCNGRMRCDALPANEIRRLPSCTLGPDRQRCRGRSNPAWRSCQPERRAMNMDRSWYKTFFSGIVVDMWRQAMPVEQTRLETEFLERYLQLKPGQRILDVPCGFGRHTLELARRGYRMTGVDISSEMIQTAQSLATDVKVPIEWRVAEMRELDWTAEFDAAFCFGNSFGYLDRDGTRLFLAAISRAMKKGARFALDYGMAAECILPRFTAREWAPIEDLFFLENNRYDVAESCIETTYTFVRNGSTDTRTGLHWVYTVREIRAMLEEAGLATCALHRSHTGEPFELGSGILIVVAEKR